MQNKELLLAVETTTLYTFPVSKKTKWPKRYAFPRKQMKCLGGNKHLHQFISYPQNFSHRIRAGMTPTPVGHQMLPQVASLKMAKFTLICSQQEQKLATHTRAIPSNFANVKQIELTG